MNQDYIFDMERLREIGWTHWDPIGRRGGRDHHPAEYDSYLLQAAGLALRGGDESQVRDYLLSCCADMGVAVDEAAAAHTAAAIVAKMARARGRLR